MWVIYSENPKEYLRSLKALDIYIKQKQDELNALKTTADSISVDYSAERVQTSLSGDSIPDLVVKIISMENEIYNQIHIFLDTRHRIIDEIQSLHNDIYIQILYKRYVEYKPLEQIAVEMSYSYVHVRRQHGLALLEFKKMIHNDTKDCAIMAP